MARACRALGTRDMGVPHKTRLRGLINPTTLDNAAQFQEIERLLVVRLGAMGDIVHTLPAVEALRCTLPNAWIGWVVEERWRGLLYSRDTLAVGARSAGRPLVDAVHVVDTHAWRRALFASETRREALRALRKVREAGYHVAIDFQGAMKSALLAQFSGAPMRVGLMHPRESAARLFYTRAVSVRGKHVWEQNLELAREVIDLASLRHSARAKATGVEWQQGRGIQQFLLPVDPAAEVWCDEQLGRQDFAIVNPGAGWGAKCWPPQRYAEVARALAQDGLMVLANIGPNEQALGRALERAAKPVVCSVEQLIALCRRARLVIGGDTGPLHLAAALGVGVVGIYGPTDPVRNGPVGGPSVVLRNPASQTSHRRFRDTEAGLLGISAAEVIAAARRLLAQGVR